MQLWGLTTTALLGARDAVLPRPQACTAGYSVSKHIIPLFVTTYTANANFEANVTVGSQSVRAVIDTGSSDTWFVSQDFQCLNISTSQPISSDLCGFKGPKLGLIPSFRQIPDVHSNLTYGTYASKPIPGRPEDGSPFTGCLDTDAETKNNAGDGQNIIGINGWTNVSFGGIDVPQVEIALAKRAVLTYSGLASGLLGLAYPSLTTVFPGNDPSTDKLCDVAIGVNDIDCNRQFVSPLLSTIFSNSLASPVFSFALGRGAPNAGFMAVGGLPDIHDPRVNITSKAIQASVPLEKENGTEVFGHYAISVDGIQHAGATFAQTTGQYFVDTATVPIVLDNSTLPAIAKVFDPPLTYDQSVASWVVNCNATAPSLSVTVGGKAFPINPQDLISYPGPTTPPGLCFSGIQGGFSSPSYPPSLVLGTVFLKNVLSVFDVGKTQMTFMSREHYQL